MEREKLIAAVADHLKTVGHGFVFEVVEGGVRQEEEWWYVPVVTQSSAGATPPREFVINVFANVEDQLEQELGVNVLLIPAA